MNGKNSSSGFVGNPKTMERTDRRRRERVTRPRPECILDAPRITWPDKRGKAPSGRLIEVVFGDEGWANGTINQETIPSGLSSNHEFRRWAWRFCRDRLCTRCFDESRVFSSEDTDFLATSTTNPLIVRMQSYFNAWTHQKDPLRRTMFLLALIGEDGARPNGYYRNDIARIAGLSPNSKSVDTLITHLTKWGFISRQKRKRKTPRYWYKSTPSTIAVKNASNEAVRRHVREWYGNPIMFHTKRYGSLQQGVNYTPLGMGHMVGPVPPRIIKETLEAVTILASIVYRWSLENANCSVGDGTFIKSMQGLDEFDITSHALDLAERLLAMYQKADKNELLQLRRWEETFRDLSRDGQERTYAFFELSDLFDSESLSFYQTWEPGEDSSEVDWP